MSFALRFNAASLNVVRPELVRLIRQAQSAHADWQHSGNAETLSSCVAVMRQVSDVLRFIELPDAAQLAADLLALLQTGNAGDTSAAQALSRGFSLLSRYLDYLKSRGLAIPELLLPEINALRQLSKRSALAESHFHAAVDLPAAPDSVQGFVSNVEVQELVRQLRHLYQLGLLGLIREGGDLIHVRLMQRAADRMCRLLGASGSGEFWFLLSAVLQGIATQQLQLNASRKRALGQADRQFRETMRASAADQLPGPTPELRRELLYLLAKCHNGMLIERARSRYALEQFGVRSDAEIESERAMLRGPAFELLESLARSVRDELKPVRDTLEQLPLAADMHSLADVPARLARIIPLLREAELHAAADSVEQQSARITHSIDNGQQIGDDALALAVESILFVDSSLDSMLKSQGMLLRSAESGEGTVTDTLARGMLDEARVLMLKGARDAIEAVKRDVSAFVDSGYEQALLGGISEQLASVRGTLAVLEQTRAAELAGEAARSIKSLLDQGIAADARDLVSESLADILICLEYYLTALANAEEPDPVILRLAGDGLLQLNKLIGKEA